MTVSDCVKEEGEKKILGTSIFFFFCFSVAGKKIQQKIMKVISTFA